MNPIRKLLIATPVLVLPLLAAGPRDADAAPLKRLTVHCAKGKTPLATGLEKARKAGGGLPVVAGICRENIRIGFDGFTLQGANADAVLIGVKEGEPTLLIEDGAGQFNTEPLAGDSGSVTRLSRSTATITDGTSNTLIVSESSTADLNQFDVSGTTEIRDGSASTIGFSETPAGTASASVDDVRVGWRSYVQ